MSDWFTPDADDVRKYGFSATEYQVIVDDLEDGVTPEEVLQAVVDDLVPYIVSELATPGRQAGPEGSIPPEAKRCFKALVVNDLVSRLTDDTAKKLMGKARTQNTLQALEWLKRKSQQKGGITTPDTPADKQPENDAPNALSVAVIARPGDRASMKGLM